MSTHQISRLHTAPVKTVDLTAHKHFQDVSINQKEEFSKLFIFPQNNQHIFKLELQFSTTEP